jgi:hypothetical protein
MESTNVGSEIALARPVGTGEQWDSVSTLPDIYEMARAVHASGTFKGIKTVEAAYSLMLICASDQMHPIAAMRRFHFYDNQITTRAEWALAEFQRRGGRIRWLHTDAKLCKAHFTHSAYDSVGFELELKLEDFRHLTGKDNWKNNPAAMLRARMETQGIKMIDPGVFAGVPVDSEIDDAKELTAFQQIEQAPMIDITPKPAPRIEQAPDVEVIGQILKGGYDDRPYFVVVKDAVAAANRSFVDEAKAIGVDVVKEPFTVGQFHGMQVRHAESSGFISRPLGPMRTGEAIKIITDHVYPNERDAVRAMLNTFYTEQIAAGIKGLAPADQAKPVPAEDVSQEPPEPGSDG